MVADERPAFSEDGHTHDVVSDLGVAKVGLGKVSRGDAFEGLAVRRLLRDALAGVLADLAVDEDQRVVLVGGDEVDGVPAVAPAVLEDARDALEVLFRLEDMSGLHPVDTGEGMALMVDMDAPGAQKIEYALIAWKSMRDDLASGTITPEEYEDWRASFDG